MSERSNFNKGLVVFFLIYLSSIMSASPDGWIIESISSGGMISSDELAVDGDQVAYLDTGQVMVWTPGGGSRQISDGQNDCSSIRLSKGTVAWFEQIENRLQVMIWDGHTVRQVSSGPNEREWIRLSGNCVAWKENIGWNWQYLLWDGQTTRQITSGTNHDRDYRLWEGMLAWNESIQGLPQILFWDGQAIRQISSGQNSCGNFDLSDGQLVWLESISGKDQVIFWDESTVRQISSGQNSCKGIHLDGETITWLEEIQGKYQVMLWKEQNRLQLSGGHNTCDDEIRFSDGKVVWRERIGGQQQVMYWNGEVVSQITANLKAKEELQLAGDMLAWFEVNSFLVPRVYLYCWSEGQKDLLSVLGLAHYPRIAISSSIIAWTGPDSMDDAQVYVARKGQPSVTKRPEGDINQDFKVDLMDLSILSAHWLVDCAETPEIAACIN